MDSVAPYGCQKWWSPDLYKQDGRVKELERLLRDGLDPRKACVPPGMMIRLRV